MLKPFVVRLALGCAAAALLISSADAADLALKRVMLSSGGVGYFEYQAEVNGTETLEIPVRLDQVDDVLKSAVVFDDKGGSGAIELQGKDSLNEIFRTMPIGPEAFNSPADLYAALQGEEVSVSDPVSATGKIVSVVEETTKDEKGGQSVRHRMAIMTTNGLVQFVLEDARGIKFTNQALDEKVNGALTALAANRQRELRTLKITARGDGARTVTVGFVVEAPLWKTSYRLVTANDGKARLQGWAVIDNASGQDWKDVELTLVSGNPVTFKQALYDKYYVDRESVPVEVLGRVTPRRDEGGVKQEAAPKEEESDGQGTPIEPAPSEPAMAPAPEAPPAEDVVVTARKAMPAKPGLVAASSSEATTQVIFTLSNPVTAGSGQQLTVPIIDRQVPGDLVSDYQPDTSPIYPLSSIKLTNTTDTGLPPGIVTLFDTASGRTVYDGDAVLSVLPIGENRMLSFAVDQKVKIDTTSKDDTNLLSVKIAKGTMQLQSMDHRTTTYTIKGAEKEDRSIIIETPRYDWTLKSQDISKLEVAGQWLRIPVSVAAGKTETLDVVWEHTRDQEISLDDLGDDQVAYYAGADGKLPEAVRATFAQMAQLKAEVRRVRNEINANNLERGKISNEQARIRANLAAVPDGDLKNRYLKTLGQQEDRLAELDKSDAQLQAQKDAADQALSDYIAGLNL